MWCVVSFDLPVGDKDSARKYRLFRKSLVSFGFSMLQESVYSRYFDSDNRLAVIQKKVISCVPAAGSVMIFSIPDQQWRKTVIIHGSVMQVPFPPPDPWLIL